MVSTLLAGSFSLTAFANNHEIPYRTQATLADAFDVTENDLGVNYIDPDRWYQLEVSTPAEGDAAKVLVQVRDYETGRLYLKVVPQASLKLADATSENLDNPNPSLTSSLWKIEVVKKDLGTFMYRFTNKETGYQLTYNCAETNEVELSDLADGLLQGAKATLPTDTIKSDVDMWRWYTTDRKTTGSFGVAKLYTFNHTREKVIGLALNNKNEVVLVDIPYEDLNSNDDQQMVANYNILQLTVRNAGARVLTAADINTMIDADGSWDPATGRTLPNKGAAEFKGVINDLTSGEYVAETSLATGIDQATAYWGYNILLNKKGTSKYFMVATDETYENDKLPGEYAFLKVLDADYLKLTADNKSAAATNVAEAIDPLKARYHWKVTYFPTPDSLAFEPLNASIIGNKDKTDEKSWLETPLATKNLALDMYYNTINAGVAHASASGNQGVATATSNCNHTKGAFVPVALTDANRSQDGIDNTEVLSVSTPMNTVAPVQHTTKYGKPVLTNKPASMGVKIQFNHKYTPLKRATIADGLYFITIQVDPKNRTDYRNNGMNLVYNMWGQMMYDKEDDYQKYLDMPATQWVVKQDKCDYDGTGTPYISIYNREYGNQLKYPAFHGQLYVEEGTNNYYIINHRDYNIKSDIEGKFANNIFSCGDTIRFTNIKDIDPNVLADSYVGYKHFDPANLGYETWSVKYLDTPEYDEPNTDKYLNVNLTDKYLNIASTQSQDFEIEAIQEYPYGYTIPGLASLKRTVYVLKVRDNNLIDNGWLYVGIKDDPNGNPYYQMVHLKDVDGKNVKLAKFYFKADQVTVDGEPAYALVDITGWNAKTGDLKEGWITTLDDLNAVNISDYALYGERAYKENGFKWLEPRSKTTKVSYQTLNTGRMTQVSAFVFTKTDRPLYMPIGVDVTNGEMNTTINLFRKRGNAEIGQAIEHLFEDANNQSNVKDGSYVKGFGYLGITAEGINPVSAKGEPKNTTALYVDSVISSNPRMPQYLFMVDNKNVKDGRWCITNQHGYFESVEEADALDKSHHVFYNGYIAGRVLVNLNDSVNAYKSINMLEQAHKYAFRNYTRLGFVEGVHMHVTIANATTPNNAFNLPAGEYLFILKNDVTLKKLTDKWGVIDPVLFKDAIQKGNIETCKLDGSHKNYAFSLRYTDDSHTDVLLESQGSEGNAKIGTFSEASWVQIMDGVPVLAQKENLNGDHTAIDGTGTLSQLVAQAQIFNLEATDEIATGIDPIEVSSVKISVADGKVIINGAAGKKVSIYNVLGQPVTQTIVTSDNATFTVPAGLVVISVEGEKSIKAVVE